MPTTTLSGAPYPLGTDPLGETDLRIKALADWAETQRCRVYRAAATQVIANNTGTMVLFDTETTDLGALHSTVTNTSRITVTKAGRYEVSGSVCWDPSATGYRSLSILKNGATYWGTNRCAPAPAGINTWMQVVGSVLLAVGDYVELQVLQTSGGNLNVIGGEANAWLDVHRSGDS